MEDLQHRIARFHERHYSPPPPRNVLQELVDARTLADLPWFGLAPRIRRLALYYNPPGGRRLLAGTPLRWTRISSPMSTVGWRANSPSRHRGVRRLV